MDKLAECVRTYEELINKNYVLTLENGIVINLPFEARHFHHLVGLQYLTDIAQVKRSQYQSTGVIYRNIKKGRITQDLLAQSTFYNKIDDRLTYFTHIHEVLGHKIIINFDPSKVPKTDFKATYILYEPLSLGCYIHLCVAEDQACFYPESYIYEPSKYYISGQNLLDVVKVEVVSRSKKPAPAEPPQTKTEENNTGAG